MDESPQAYARVSSPHAKGNKVVTEEKKIQHEVRGLIDENRVINFSDAVFAFAATLLVLKIDLPNIDPIHVNAQLIGAFSSLWPQYIANIISFLVIGYYWLNHHAIFGLVKRFNATIVWLNILFLICISFIPFPVDLYGDFPMVPSVIVFYSASLAIVGFVLSGIWWYASHQYRLVSKELGKKHIQYYFARTLVAPIIFSLSIPLVIIHPLLSQFSWVLVFIGIFVVGKMFNIKVSEIEKMTA